MHGNKEGRLADGLQHLPLGLGVLRGLPLLDDGGLFQDLHGVQMTSISTGALARQEHFAIS